MKKESIVKILLGAAFCMPLMSVAATPQTTNVEVNRIDGSKYSRFASRPGEVIVKFKASSSVSVKAPQRKKFKASGVNSVDKLFASIGVSEIEQLMPLTGSVSHPRLAKGFNDKEVEAPAMDKVYRIVLNEESKGDIYQVLQQLNESDEIEFAEPNYIMHSLAIEGTPNDPYYSMQYGIRDINLPQLWTKPTISEGSQVIAILDTGVDIEHPDLKGNVWTNEREMYGSTDYDDDRNGYTDDLHGWDFINQTGIIADYNGHGTHCAGIAAACGNNGLGIIGANPDAKIMPVTVMQSTGQGDVATIIKGVDYAAANGATVISLSLGSYSDSAALKQALSRAYQTCVIVAAAGNDAYCLNHKHPELGQPAPMPMFPAAYNFVLGVQASGTDGNLASFSNYDDDGAYFTEYSEDKLFNYEVTAPGVAIMSAYPGGGYRQLSGTSMATPLVAGAVSYLLQTKEYESKEVLFGDLLNSVTDNGNLDIARAYNIGSDDRKPSLSLVSYRLDDAVAGDGDGRPDAGETVYLYPKFRNSWGTARNIRYSIVLDPLEDQSIVTIDRNEQTSIVSQLSSYATIEASNPLVLKFRDNIMDRRQIKMIFTATCDNAESTLEQELVFTVENGVEIGGVISEDMTLTADKNYIVTTNLAIPENVTLTIEPGTILKFRESVNSVDISRGNEIYEVDNKTSTLSYPNSGKIIAKGTPEKPIIFTSDGGIFDKLNLNFGYCSELEYCKFINMTSNRQLSIALTNAGVDDNSNRQGNGWAKNCEVRDNQVISAGLGISGDGLYRYRRTVSQLNCVNNVTPSMQIGFEYSNYAANIYDNSWTYGETSFIYYTEGAYAQNIVSNTSTYKDGVYAFSFNNDTGKFTPGTPSYLGSSRQEIVRSWIWDIHKNNGTTEYDLSNMLTRPVHEAHGIVWKVVVNGYDAQDEFDMLPPLGVGRHKFEVYFNRKMNHDVAPSITMGVRAPYTQTAIAEDGSWRTESFDGEELDIYTAYLTINGRSDYDGLNRIYVDDAQDDEYFVIPRENVRFNVNVQAAGSMSEGFTAEAGLGRVNLQWDNSEENFDDMLGYNMYRYCVDDSGVAADSIRVNQRIIESSETKFTDYDVVPGKTYCYYYRVMRTNMSENSPSKTVAVTPLTSVEGDANGSASVDVADVIATVNYASGIEQKPFIFEAADVNHDSNINILDVVGIIRIIVNQPETASSLMQNEVKFYVDNGLLYLDSPVELAGVQFELKLDKDSKVTASETLDGMESVGAWLSEDDYIFLTYSLSGKTIPAGISPILNIGNGRISAVTLSDTAGHNVTAIPGMSSGIADPTADWQVDEQVSGIYDMMGVKISDNAKDLDRLPKGIYIVNGCKVVK